MKLLIPAGVLTLICAGAALALAAVHSATKPVIEAEERAFRLRSIEKALPDYDNSPDQDVVTLEHNGEKVCIFRGKNGDDLVGVAFAWTQGGGYSGDITVLVGITPDGQVACEDDDNNEETLDAVGVQKLAHNETPGLGNLFEEEGWRRQFCGHQLDEGESFWKVRKDGGQIDQLTGATITSRTVSEAVQGALSFFGENREQILSAEGGTCDE